MRIEEQKQRLREEMERYAHLSYEEAKGLSRIVTYHGTPASVSFCQVEVGIVQQHKTAVDEWVQVGVSVDDGVSRGCLLARMFHVVTPVIGSLVFHADGRVERFMRDG